MSRVKHHEYKCVDGRYYVPEVMPKTPDIRQSLSEKQIRYLRLNDEMSMTEVYSMEMFLQGIKVTKGYNSAVAKERDRIVKEYSLSMNERGHYVGDLNYVWSIMQTKFPEATAKYKNYTACQYALKYGATSPCEWVPATSIKG